MQGDADDVLWLDPLWLEQGQRLTLGELAASCGLSEAELHELVDYGVLMPANLGEPAWSFSIDCVFRVRKASRLRDDLELDTHALGLAIRLLDRIDTLEAELAALRARAAYRLW
jgi:chaperone modulatory protein CbpM